MMCSAYIKGLLQCAILQGIFFAFLILSASCQSNAKVVELSSILPFAKIDTNTMTVAGLSSGGFMTTMMHYMYSKQFKGAGVFAGGPFGTLYNITHRDVAPIYMFGVAAAVLPKVGRSVADLQKQAMDLSDQGLIDPIENIKGSKAYVFQGGADQINPKFLKLSENTIAMYNFFGADTKKYLPASATHCIPTDNYGLPCGQFNPYQDGLNNCGKESIFEMFAHFYGSEYVAPRSSSTPPTGTFYDFNQSPFTTTSDASKDFMNYSGGIYIPKACTKPSSTCKFHVAFHGCYSSFYSNGIDDLYAKKSGYLQVADVNNVIIVFPRAAPIAYTPPTQTNNACWDWFGLTVEDTTLLKEAPQVKAVRKILNAIIRQAIF